MERDDLVFKAKLAEQAERYVFCALLRVARWFLRVDFERRFWFVFIFFFYSHLERQKVNSRLTTFHDAELGVCLILFLRARGKRERDAACASAFSRERSSFPCIETAFARVFFSEAPAFVCVLARVRRGNIETTRWWWERCLSKRPKSERREFFLFSAEKAMNKGHVWTTQNLL